MSVSIGRYSWSIVSFFSLVAILLAYTSNKGLPLGSSNLAGLLLKPQPHRYEVQIFSRDPLILYIRDFLSQGEIQHVLKKR